MGVGIMQHWEIIFYPDASTTTAAVTAELSVDDGFQTKHIFNMLIMDITVVITLQMLPEYNYLDRYPDLGCDLVLEHIWPNYLCSLYS